MTVDELVALLQALPPDVRKCHVYVEPFDEGCGDEPCLLGRVSVAYFSEPAPSRFVSISVEPDPIAKPAAPSPAETRARELLRRYESEAYAWQQIKADMLAEMAPGSVLTAAEVTREQKKRALRAGTPLLTQSEYAEILNHDPRVKAFRD